ncbi:MAG: gliding motility-associated ABC transporter ATP-binding subunit GldA [Bacteroidetes bacterium RIFCSPLOWO2_12_FULL_35_15]|nr:MAG: gliding motility-associated ABC transporter ATP-binding subunit GldA [Bacteroidetes bacterium RIFCSPLOWO2_12_FULL_35_15]
MSIKVNNITKIYGEQRALDDVSFEVNTGEVVGFLGPNGAGKSTMMKILTCFIPQTSGTASVCGFDVAEESLEVRKNVGYLPEHNPLYLEMYVKEYLEFIAGLHHLKNVKSRIAEMIEMTGLQVEQKKKIGALSKGYRQRVGLAQALIHDPKVLILDEPTTGLDPNQLAEIRNLIISVGKHKTVMLSTHIMQEVEAVCDRVIIVNNGQIVANDITSVLQNSQSKNIQFITVEFDKETTYNSLKNIEGVFDAKNINGNIWQLEANTDKDIRADIFQYAVQNKLAVLTLHKEEQRLEDVFKNLTK